MTPLDTNSILRLLRKAESAQTNWEPGDWFAEHYIRKVFMAFDEDAGEQQDFEHIAACDPTPISALCRLALEGVAMRRAVSDEHDAINDMRKQDGNSDWKEGYESGLLGVARRTSELLAALEKGE